MIFEVNSRFVLGSMYRLQEINDQKISPCSQTDLTLMFACPFCSAWQMRRLVYTKEDIFIAFVGEDFVRDRIPLAEVLRVDELGSDFIKNIATKKFGKGTRKSSKLFRIESLHERINNIETAIVVSTIDRGYNSGRTYHILPNTPSDSATLLSDLTHLIASARRRVKPSENSKIQRAIREVMGSQAMSAVTGFLLFAVKT